MRAASIQVTAPALPQVETNGKDRMAQQQNTNEPRRAPTACDKRSDKCADKNYCYRADSESRQDHLQWNPRLPRTKEILFDPP
jgi:hypothetical protein